MINIAMAILVHNSKIFVAQRNITKNQGGLWEFPGGKQEAGETLPECLAREFMEEFGKEISVGEKFSEHSYTYENLGDFHLTAFWAFAQNDTIAELNDHMAYKWVSVSDMEKLEFCPADLPFIEDLKKLA